MGILRSALRGTRMETNFIGAPSFRYKNPYMLDCYADDKYASIYPSIKAISNEFMKIRPYAIDANGKKMDARPPEAVNALYHPNQLDSAVSFFEKLAVMNLTHRMTYLLVWRRVNNEAKPNGDITPNNIAGFTFLENPSISRLNGKTFYNIGSQSFTEDEVIAIPGGVDPEGLYTGYAPGVASAKWATLDEYIADFQKGFFENGAVPAGQFVITAASERDYDDTVDKLQSAHRGAGKNNNVTYTPRPVDPTSGKPAEAKIEWIPYQQSNKDIDFKNLFEQANKRLDSTFGVPASVRGVGESNNYATARVDQQNFIRFTIEPLALRIYSQITHELNRITGGLGYAITFSLDYPAVADEEKVQAETKNVEVTALLQLINKGYTLDSAIDALQLSKSYKLLDVGQSTDTTINNDKPDVDEGKEVTQSPDPTEIDGVTPINKKPQPNAKLTDEQQLEVAAKDFMQAQVDRAVDDYTNQATNKVKNEVQPDPTDDELNAFVVAIMAIIVGILATSGKEGYEIGESILKAAGESTDKLTKFTLTDTTETSYTAYMKRVGESYGSDTAKSIRAVLAQSDSEEWTRAQTQSALRDIVNTDEWRIKRLAATELNRSQGIGNVEAIVQIQSQTGVQMEKSLYHPEGPVCEFCKALEGQWEKADQPLVAQGAAIIGVDGGIYPNDFAPNEGYDPHPNGKGVIIFRTAD